MQVELSLEQIKQVRTALLHQWYNMTNDDGIAKNCSQENADGTYELLCMFDDMLSNPVDVYESDCDETNRCFVYCCESGITTTSIFDNIDDALSEAKSNAAISAVWKHVKHADGSVREAVRRIWHRK